VWNSIEESDKWQVENMQPLNDSGIPLFQNPEMRIPLYYTTKAKYSTSLYIDVEQI
jgi:hypothetical protein